MGNDYFKFKEFEVRQSKAAMKVCTDSCLFGALLPDLGWPQGRVLDIGTGTGLLSLMYAQRFEGADIDALEIDEPAFEQARENFETSPWSERLNAILGDFKDFCAENLSSVSKYGVIFSNPPFFEGDLKSIDNQRNKALHSTELSFSELVQGVAGLMLHDGIFTVMIPYSRRAEMIRIAKDNGLFLHKEYLVANTIKHDYFRTIQFFRRDKQEPETELIYIREGNQQYSLKFRTLLAPYYLYL